ncbi:tetratricopeptide (TPR) repeat protein [Flavobacterium nitrogenifigens]|uniref:Tetratricopeptide (TPR) repeat protein n=2 Tax=Flavobacterium TaxID=237 RepID=A0A7W7ITX3_9FLAO|nr:MULTISPECIES: tetratricopeptide repeat protein [Flavobacterium]MBB4800471.1 tetratricopeptide (TPR) repeat protein [Flavobacterium nitrogenifigens]MBB6385779.1 tetratricopeptide (TPR) repeat protein [Flavobacterium notoginsengisoli]
MNRFLVLVALILISFKSFACLNGDTKILKNEFIAYMDHRGLVPQGHNFFPKEYPAVIKELEGLYKKTNDLDYLSDKGYLLILLGKYNEAENLYLNIEKIKPNRYSTASNLGTLYELMGENQKAYDWIKKSIEINPESHNGSEWLHLKILEAKIKKLTDVTGQFLINTNFGTAATPETKLSKEEIEKLAKEVYYQVNERISFIEPKDKIISILLFELGNLVQLIGEHENALRIYNKARVYGFDNDLIVARMIFSAQGKAAYYKQKTIEFGTKLKSLRETKKGIDLDYVYQLETSLIILSTILFIILIAFVVMFIKWKKLKRVTPTS